MSFTGHYEPWIRHRVAVITAHFGQSWFRGKRVLDLGCGHGEIGAALHRLGARVTCSDARAEHLDAVRAQKPFLDVVQHDLDDDQWPYRDDFDLILHTGVLYHLKNYRRNLEHCVRSCRHLFLETEILDSDKDEVLFVDENQSIFDKAFNGVGCRPSQANLENLLTTWNCSIERCFRSELNAEFHIYDWPIENTGGWRHGLRRAWFVECPRPRAFVQTIRRWLGMAAHGRSRALAAQTAPPSAEAA